jgi:hypothetical protein
MEYLFSFGAEFFVLQVATKTYKDLDFFSWRDNPLVGLGLPHSRGSFFFLDHTRHTTFGRTPLDE